MKDYYVYDSVTGAILWGGQVQDDLYFVLIEPSRGPAIAAREAACNPLTQWHNPATNRLEDKAQIAGPDKTSCAADGAEMVTWSGLPNPTHVRVIGQTEDEFDVTDGDLSLTFNSAGRWYVFLDAGSAYLSRQDEIDAT